MLPQKLAFIDVETTGMRSYRDRIIEVGVVRVENNEVVQTFQTLLNPQTYVNPIIESLTGIKSAELESAPTFEDIKRELYEILDDCVFVAHNVRFDYSFIKNEFKQFDMSFSPKQFCTVKLSKALFPHHPRHNLDALIERFNIECKNRHRAFDDAHVLWEFYKRVQTLFPVDIFEQALQKIMKKPSLPLNIPQNTLDNLPSSPGVYIFYGENGMPLYIGKSKNIKDRVLSHFSQDHSSSTEMKISQQIQSIETITTAGELGALFKEANLVKEMQPLYNRKLRRSRKLIVLKQITNQEGYHTIREELLPPEGLTTTDDVVGVFRSKKQVKEFLIHVTEKHGLCEKILGLEHTKSECFGYRLGRCKGACSGREQPLTYNLRFLLAFSTNKIKPWPFSGPIYIEEGDEDNKEIFIVDKWCYMGSMKTSTDDAIMVKTYNFDLDLYKILVGFLRSEKNLGRVKTLDKSPIQQYLMYQTNMLELSD